MKNYRLGTATIDLDREELVALAKAFQVGDRVQHLQNRKQGIVTEIQFDLATPAIWVREDNLDGREINPEKNYRPQDLIKTGGQGIGRDPAPRPPDILVGESGNESGKNPGAESKVGAEFQAEPEISDFWETEHKSEASREPEAETASKPEHNLAAWTREKTAQNEREPYTPQLSVAREVNAEEAPARFVAFHCKAVLSIEEQLTEEERADRQRLELCVEQSFYYAGRALRELRDRKLYRDNFETFERYCRARFGYRRRHSYQLIDASYVVENLCANGAQILPTTERQVRPLTVLTPEIQQRAWQDAVEKAGGKVPSGEIVKSVVSKLKRSDPIDKPLVSAKEIVRLGQAFILTRLTEDRRKYNGCWAIAVEVNDFSVKILTYDGVLEESVKPDNLTPVDSLNEVRQITAIAERIRRLRDCGLLDRGAYGVLEDLGKQRYLTEVEEGLLTWLEKYYGVDRN